MNDTTAMLASPLPAASSSEGLVTMTMTVPVTVTETETVTLTPGGCSKAFVDFVPWDNPENLVSADTLQVVEVTVYCCLMPLLLLVGLVANPLSCLVFYRLVQGFLFVCFIA